jgi:hypothetical protein
MTGFQGWRYFDGTGQMAIGDWLAPKPDAEARQVLIPFLNSVI